MCLPISRMRPGRFSQGGFLGLTEKLETVMQHDAALLERFHLNYETIAARLDDLLNLCTGKIRKVNHQHFTIEVEVLKGFQICPWATDPYNSQCTAGAGVKHASVTWTISNKKKKIKMTGPGLIVHLIRDHHFFEGQESPYRVDPIRLSAMLDLAE